MGTSKRFCDMNGVWNSAVPVCKCKCNAFKHEVLRLSYCDSAVSVISFLTCVCSRGHIFSPIGQNVCLDKMSDKFENGSCRVKN